MTAQEVMCEREAGGPNSSFYQEPTSAETNPLCGLGM
jgi:hypothetical protein